MTRHPETARPGRRWLLYAGVVLLGVLGLNGAAVAVSAIHAYRRSMAPLLLRAGVECRFTPTCSRYAEIVIVRDGLVWGSAKTAARLVRCGPWTARGTLDAP